jgi:hypothetical protein
VSNGNKNKVQQQQPQQPQPVTQPQQTLSTPRFYLQRQSSCKDVPESAPKNNSIIKHSVSEANISKTSMSSKSSSRKNSFSRSSRNSSVPNVSKIPMNSARTEKNGPVKAPPSYITSTPVDIYVNSKISLDSSPSEEVEFVPVSIDRPVGLDLDDFLPVSGAASMCVLYLPERIRLDLFYRSSLSEAPPELGIPATAARHVRGRSVGGADARPRTHDGDVGDAPEKSQAGLGPVQIQRHQSRNGDGDVDGRSGSFGRPVERFQQ